MTALKSLTMNNLKQMMFPYFDQIPRDRVAGSKGNVYIVCRDISTPSPWRCSYSYQHRDASLSPQLCNGAYYGTLEIWSLLYKILSLTAIFPFQTETIQVALSLESRSEGKVDFKAYKDYFTAGAHWNIIIFLILVNIAAQVSYVLQDWWLSSWANELSTVYAMTYGKGSVILLPDPGWYFTPYSVLTAGTVLFGISRSLLMFYVLVNSSQTLHKQMLESVLRAPVLFFDRNPTDISSCDGCGGRDGGGDSLDCDTPDSTWHHLLCSSEIFLRDITRCETPGMRKWWVCAITTTPLSSLCSNRQCVLRPLLEPPAKEARSPVFSHLASSLQGRWTIRAFKAQQRFQELFDTHQDLHSEAWFLFLTTSRWFALCLDAICAVFVIGVAFGSLFLAETLNVGQVGLVLSLALTFMVMVPRCIRQSAAAETMVKCLS
ncbi:multidrug resistance-associated protein 4-like isoform X1 [Sus scrofa]|uniref:multidrug resistance-associated protein 4-like isoform X1 n=1 Tax=Sus scrofa TaxID=9823 RepID=UPI000A2B2A24|nr:multidrug resistance-associated protein 4-like isoform X1 [Sus scrofa]